MSTLDNWARGFFGFKWEKCNRSFYTGNTQKLVHSSNFSLHLLLSDAVTLIKGFHSVVGAYDQCPGLLVCLVAKMSRVV